MQLRDEGARRLAVMVRVRIGHAPPNEMQREDHMLRSVLYGLLALVFPASVCAQTPVGSFADVAGKWVGASSRGTKTTIEVEPNGRFKLETSVGKDAGLAKLQDGVLIIPTSDNQGQYKLSRNGDTLEGPVHWRGIDATVKLTRTP
jgi:hypothetical protein